MAYLFVYALFYLMMSESFFVAVMQLLLYISLVAVFVLGRYAAQRGDFLLVNRVLYVVLINIVIHLVCVFFNVTTYTQTFVNGFGEYEEFALFGLYGSTGMPYQFVIYIIVGYYLISSQNRMMQGAAERFFCYILIILALVTSDSRIALVAFFATAFGVYTLVFTPFLLIALPVLAVNDKMRSVINLDLNYIMSDPSLGMRFENIERYLNWVDWTKFVFGAGSQSFLQFSSQYGFPGPLDMLPVRLITEFGILMVSLFCFFVIRSVVNFSGNVFCKNRSVYIKLILFITLYSLVNEGLVTSRSGHLLFFVLGLFTSRVKIA